VSLSQAPQKSFENIFENSENKKEKQFFFPLPLFLSFFGPLDLPRALPTEAEAQPVGQPSTGALPFPLSAG
jgi:hypothetical protein